MGPFEAVKLCYKRTFEYNGRSSRSEFWWFWLYGTVIIVLLCVFAANEIPLLAGCFGIIAVVNVLPGISVRVRRLHDVGKSGWWMLGWCVGLIRLYLFICFMESSDYGENEYGQNPVP